MSASENKDINSRVSVLENESKNVLLALEKQSIYQSKHQEKFDAKFDKLIDSLNEQTIELKETRFNLVAYEESKKKEELLTGLRITEIEKSVDNIYEHYRKPIERLIVSQNNRDKIKNSMLSNSGKTIMWILGLASTVFIAYLLGINPKDFKI